MKHPISPQQRTAISMGVELETYSIELPDYRICRDLHFPRRSSVEKGERFIRDLSIGSEYTSKVFYTIREAFFLLKSSLRKYIHFREGNGGSPEYTIFPVGGWIDRFAGCHIHLALGNKPFPYEEAAVLSRRLHDHIPFLIVIAANSPVWREKLNSFASSRLLRGSEKYCQVTRREMLYKHRYRELTFNRGGTKKPPTLEVRVGDSSLPEYIAAMLVVCKAVALSWRKRKRSYNHSTHENYRKARERAIRDGTRARLVWTNHWITVPQYVDLFFRKYEEELEMMDIPDDVLRVFKYLKKGINQSDLIRAAAERCRERHLPTWQRQFARRYSIAIEELLNGNSLERFARRLGVRLPNIERTWLGRRESRW
jgi:hypothetical protein